MLSFLDAGVNVKGASNENFAREIMEIFTMGVGNYTEKDIREAARAFTGWNYVDLKFVVNKDQHDDGEKTFLGHTGRLDGIDVIDIIMQQPATADYIAGKIYRYFVRQELSPELQKQLGAVLRDSHYEITPLLETIFLSRDFYSPASVGTQIKSPVQLAGQHRYKKLGQKNVPGVPDFNLATSALGQQLFSPPTVAGGAKAGLRRDCCSNAAISLATFCFPDISFLPPDRYTGGGEVRRVAERIRQGMDITTATMDEAKSGDHRRIEQECRPGRGIQHALRQFPRLANGHPESQAHSARYCSNQSLADGAGCETSEHHAGGRQPDPSLHARSTGRRCAEEDDCFLNKDLGTTDIAVAQTYMEDSLRLVLHLIMSQPEYQLD